MVPKCGGPEEGEMGEESQKVQISNYKMIKSRKILENNFSIIK